MGGGGAPETTINSTDPVYNAGQLAIANKQQEMADKLFNIAMYGVEYNPNESQSGAYVDGKWVSSSDLSGYSNAYSIENPEYVAWKEQRSRLGQFTDVDKWLERNPEPAKTIANPNILENKTLGEIYGYNPDEYTSAIEYQQNLIQANQDVLGAQTEAQLAELGLTKEQIESQRRILGPTTEYALEKVQSDRSLLAPSTELQLAQLESAKRGVELKAPIMEEYARKALEPLDIQTRQDQAQVGVQNAFDNSLGQFKRQMFTSGISPGDGAYASNINQRTLSLGSSIAAARAKAKTDAETEQFNRLQSAMTTGF